MYYDGCNLLNQTDLNNEKPEIYITTGNRSSGKTTYFNRFMFNKYIQGLGKMVFLYRFQYELNNCDEKIFKTIGELFFPKYKFNTKIGAKGIYTNLYLNDEHCGYAITLNGSDNIRKMSHMFSDCNRIMFDEFQSETNHYCNNELNKFISIHQSIARGHGKQSRYVPVYMASNCITLLNPYFTALGVANRLQKNTKILRGNGWVLEQSLNQSAADAQQNSTFNKAFSNENYIAYSSENMYLNDNNTFVEKITGKNRYFCTLKYKNGYYGVREYIDEGIIYCSKSYDQTAPIKIAVTTNDCSINYLMLKSNQFYIDILKYYFQKGCFRFDSLQSKECILNALSY